MTIVASLTHSDSDQVYHQSTILISIDILTRSPPAGLLSLSPLLYNLPSLSGMGAFKGYLPNAVTNQPATAQPEHEIPPGEKLSFAKWQHADLHDGHGDRYI